MLKLRGLNELRYQYKKRLQSQSVNSIRERAPQRTTSALDFTHNQSELKLHMLETEWENYKQKSVSSQNTPLDKSKISPRLSSLDYPHRDSSAQFLSFTLVKENEQAEGATSFGLEEMLPIQEEQYSHTNTSTRNISKILSEIASPKSNQRAKTPFSTFSKKLDNPMRNSSLLKQEPIRVSLDGGGMRQGREEPPVPYFSSRCMSASNINPAGPSVAKKVKTGSKQPSQKKMPHKVQKQNQQPIQSTLALLEKQLALEIEIKSNLQQEKPQFSTAMLQQDREAQEGIGRTMSALRIGTEGLSYVESKPSRMKKVSSKQEGASTPLIQPKKEKKKELKLMPCHLSKPKKAWDSQKEEKKQFNKGGGAIQAYRKNVKKSLFKKENQYGGTSLSGRNIKQVEITLSEQGREKKVHYSANCTPHNETIPKTKDQEQYMSPTARKHFKIKEAIRKDKMKKQSQPTVYQNLVTQESPVHKQYIQQKDVKRSRQIDTAALPRAFSDEQMEWMRYKREDKKPKRESVEKEEQRLDQLLKEMMEETQRKINLFQKEKEIELERTQRLSTVPIPEDEGISAAPIPYKPNLVNRVIAERAENAFRNSTRRIPSSTSHYRQNMRRSQLAEPEGEFDSEPDSEPFS